MEKYYKEMKGYIGELRITIKEHVPVEMFEALFSEYKRELRDKRKYLSSVQLSDLRRDATEVSKERISLFICRPSKVPSRAEMQKAIRGAWEMLKVYRENMVRARQVTPKDLNEMVYTSVRIVLDRKVNRRGTLRHLNPLEYVSSRLSDLETCSRVQ